MAGGRVRGEMNRVSELKDSPHDGYFLQFEWLRWSTFSGHPSGRWKHPRRTSHIFVTFLHLQSFSQQLQFVSPDFGICFLSLSSKVPWFVFRAQAFLNRSLLVQCHPSCALRRQYSEKKSCWCVRTTFQRCAPQATPWFCGYRRRTPFTRYEPKYENKLDESKRFTNEKRSSHADSSGRKCLKKNTEQLTASTSFNTYRSILWHYVNHESDDCASGTCQQGATTCSRRIVWTRKVWKNILRMSLGS